MDRDYELFAMVVDTGSLSAAGRAMSISPAMVSKRLARLENRLGVRLLHRTTRRLALTAAGERFHSDVVGILQSIRDAEGRITGLPDGPSGPLRVSAPTSFGRLHIAPILERFLAQYPDVDLQLELTDAYVDLLAGGSDVAIRITSDIPASLTAHRISANRRIVCASPAYLERYGAPRDVAALSAHHLLAADGQLPWRLVSDGRRLTVEGRSRVRTNSSEVVRELAVAGAGIALRSLWDVADALDAGLLVRALTDWEGPDDLAIYALHPRMPAPPLAIGAFVEFLRHAIDPQRWDRASDG